MALRLITAYLLQSLTLCERFPYVSPVWVGSQSYTGASVQPDEATRVPPSDVPNFEKLAAVQRRKNWSSFLAAASSSSSLGYVHRAVTENDVQILKSLSQPSTKISIDCVLNRTLL